MGSRANNRSFNNVRHSLREQRRKRHQQGRLVLLSMLGVIALLLLTLFLFLICSIVGTIRENAANKSKEPADTDPSQNVAVTYEQMTQETAKIHTGDLIVVSEKRNAEYLFPPITLVEIKNVRQLVDGSRPYGTILAGKLQNSAATALNQMLTDFYRIFEDGRILVSDAYRSKEEQEPFSTAVGFSEHHTGLVIRLKTYVDGSDAAAELSKNANSSWIYDNCAKFGYICRYPEEKSAKTGVSAYTECFRYVGVAHATYLSRNDLCLEEYVELLKNSYSGSTHLQINAEGKNYEVYYVPAGGGEVTTLNVPTNYPYTVSGDNIGGFIVTVNLSDPIA